MHLIEQLAQRYAPPPKIFLRASDQLEIIGEVMRFNLKSGIMLQRTRAA